MNWSYFFRDKWTTLMLGIISFFCNMNYYSELRKIIKVYDLADDSNYKNGLFINGKKAFEVLKKSGFEQVVFKALIGVALIVFMAFIVWNCFGKYIYDTFNYSEYNIFFWVICIIYILNILLSISILKWVCILWVIIFIGSLYTAANSESVS